MALYYKRVCRVSCQRAYSVNGILLECPLGCLVVNTNNAVKGLAPMAWGGLKPFGAGTWRVNTGFGTRV